MVDFREMPYARPDVDELKKCYEAVIDELKNAPSYEAARSAFFSLQEQEKSAETMMSLCSVRNTIDTTDEYYAGEMKWLREQMAGMIPLRKQGNLNMQGHIRGDGMKKFHPSDFHEFQFLFQ